jgi:hypothetical protein
MCLGGLYAEAADRLRGCPCGTAGVPEAGARRLPQRSGTQPRIVLSARCHALYWMCLNAGG